MHYNIPSGLKLPASYDASCDAIYLKLGTKKPNKPVDTHELVPLLDELYIMYDECEGRVLGIEILGLTKAIERGQIGRRFKVKRPSS